MKHSVFLMIMASCIPSFAFASELDTQKAICVYNAIRKQKSNNISIEAGRKSDGRILLTFLCSSDDSKNLNKILEKEWFVSSEERIYELGDGTKTVTTTLRKDNVWCNDFVDSKNRKVVEHEIHCGVDIDTSLQAL